jgi:inhibitor of KinA sporulation pathway (predicted exonuclease)
MAKLLDKIVVIDLESTCWEGSPPEGQVSEIIEIGVCTVDVASLGRGDKQAIFIKPVKSEISEFCTKLTTLTPEHFKSAGTLADAAKILKKQFQSQDRLWASWGDYDRRQFERVCKEAGMGYPFGISHLNVKMLFAVTHHRGINDAWNIAGLLAGLLGKSRGL